jgi:hypothetical protein
VGTDLSHVFVSDGVGEVLGEDGAAVGVELDLPGGVHPRSLKAEVEPADAREERSDSHVTPLPPGLRGRNSSHRAALGSAPR